MHIHVNPEEWAHIEVEEDLNQERRIERTGRVGDLDRAEGVVRGTDTSTRWRRRRRR